jgi:hypothetical protein
MHVPTDAIAPRLEGSVSAEPGVAVIVSIVIIVPSAGGVLG